MELTGLTEAQVDEYVDAFAALMRQRTRAAFTLAAQSMTVNSEVVVASPIDALGEIIGSWKTSVKTDLMPYLSKLFAKAGKAVSTPLGIAAHLDTIAPVLGSVEESLTAYANDLYDAGHLAVMVGWQDGETVMAMSDRLQSVPKQKEDKAHSVAQTLVTAVVNGGEWEQLLAISAKFGNITLKEWMATQDSHTRFTHEAADGQTVPLEQKFVVGDTLLDFPGDPFGDLDEIINCRCTTRYHSEPVSQNSTTQTSPDALSADSSVDTTEQISASAATNSNWKESDHPRGKNGKFIKKGTSTYVAVTKLAKNGKNFSSWTKSEQSSFLNEIPIITNEQWNNLTTDQKHDIETAVSDALDEGISGAADAQSHLDELGSAEVFDDADLNVFDPDTALPDNAPSGGVAPSGVSAQAQEAADKGFITHQQASDLMDALALDEISEDEAKLKLAGMLTPAPTAAVEYANVNNDIYEAFVQDEISLSQYEKLSSDLVNGVSPSDVVKSLKKMQGENKAAAAAAPSPDTDIDAAYEHNTITQSQHYELSKLSKTASAAELQQALDKATSETTEAKKKLKGKINSAHANGMIDDAQHAELLNQVDKYNDPNGVEKTLNNVIAKNAAEASEPDVAPITTGSPKPIKITHGLIHAKYAPGTTVAVDEKGNKIVWNGSSYDIIGPNGDPVATGIKKSKLYALLNTYNADAQWHEPGNQPVAVTHAAPLDAAPTPNPVPHPVSFPAPSAVDSALDDAFGPTNTGLASPSTPAVAQGMDMSKWKMVGGQAGSNKGALFEAPDGKRYYVKSLKSKEHAQNEVLAAALYRAAGINVPEVRHVTEGAPPGWSNVIASPIVPNAKSNKKGLTTPGAFQEQAQQTYAVNAWLANFDVVGLTHDNMIESDGQVHLIDVGGSMGYRAQGNKKKASDWNEDPTSALEGLRNPNLNPSAASVFGSMTYEQQRESAKALLGITDAQIDQMVKDAGLPAKQAAILKARRDAILKLYGLDANNNSTLNVPAPTPTAAPTVSPTPVDPLSLGELPTGTPGEIVDSLNKLHAVGDLTDQDHQALVKGVTNGKTFMGKMVVGAHNTKVKAANYTPPPADPGGFGAIHNPDLDTPTAMPVGTSVSAIDIIDGVGGFAYGEVHGSGSNEWGESWSVAPGLSGTVLVQMDGANGATVMTYPDFVAYTADNNIQWESNDGSTSIFPKTNMPAKKATAPVSTLTPAPAVVSTTPSVTTADDIPGNKQYDFYQHFKAENVSPAWSGAKIYKSMQAAKLKMAGDPQFANISDAELLKILDKQHNIAKATNVKAYSTKTRAWLKTPQGQKAFKELNSGIATPPPGIAKKVAPSASPAVPTTPNVSLDTSPTLSPDAKVEVYGKFKGSTYGKYYKDPAADIYWNAVQQAKLQGTTPGAVLAAVDEEGSKKFGVANAGVYQAKVNDWLKTPSGQALAKQIDAGTYAPGTSVVGAKKAPAKKAKKVSAYGGGYGSSIAGPATHPASTPLNQKVQDVSQNVPPFDESKTAADFPVINNTQAAALWDDMVEQSGEPFQAKQKASLKYYTTNPGYKAMNNYLRGQQGATDATQQHINNAQAGMRPTTRDIVLHRGNSSFTDGAGRHWGSYEEISQYVGTDLHQEAFFSASVGGKADFGGSIMMEIEVPKGTPAAYVKAFSAYKNSESEMLLAANLRYRIVKVEKKGYTTVVRMRVVAKDEA